MHVLASSQLELITPVAAPLEGVVVGREMSRKKETTWWENCLSPSMYLQATIYRVQFFFSSPRLELQKMLH